MTKIMCYLTSVIFKDYVIKRWNFDNNSHSMSTFKDRFYEGTGVVVRARNSIARLYWASSYL